MKLRYIYLLLFFLLSTKAIYGQGESLGFHFAIGGANVIDQIQKEDFSYKLGSIIGLRFVSKNEKLPAEINFNYTLLGTNSTYEDSPIHLHYVGFSGGPLIGTKNFQFNPGVYLNYLTKNEFRAIPPWKYIFNSWDFGVIIKNYYKLEFLEERPINFLLAGTIGLSNTYDNTAYGQIPLSTRKSNWIKNIGIFTGLSFRID